MATRTARKLLPVRVRARFVGGATRDDVCNGPAVLSIIPGDATDSDESAYWCKAIFAGDRCTGFRLTKFGGGEVYDPPRDLSSCDYPAHVYNPHRPAVASMPPRCGRRCRPSPGPSRKPSRPDPAPRPRESRPGRPAARPLSDLAYHLICLRFSAAG